MTRLMDWRGAPVMPTDWMDGYRRIYPIHREPTTVGGGGPRGELHAYRLKIMPRGRREDGVRFGERR